MKDDRTVDGKLDVVLRTRRFALDVIRLCASLPRSMEAQVLGKQLVRSGTSVGAHIREEDEAVPMLK